MAASDHLGPQFYYHASPPQNRESIAEHGLRTDFSDDEANGTAGPASIYLSHGVQSEDRWHGQDVWRVDVRGLPLERDIEIGDYSTYKDIGPERLRLHKTA